MGLDGDGLVNAGTGLIDKGGGVGKESEVAIHVIEIAATHGKLVGDLPDVSCFHQTEVGLKGPYSAPRGL